MNDLHDPTQPTSQHFTRKLFDISGPNPGPTTIILAGIHANEPAGRIAAAQVAEQLSALRQHLQGRVVALLGNLAATPRAVRYIDADLNRAFQLRPLRRDEPNTPVRERLIETLPHDAHEHTEREQLLDAIEDILADHHTQFPVHAIDLHTFSAPGPPFAVFADTIRNRNFAAALPVPLVLGLVEELQGTIVDLLSDAGLVSMVLEEGQHDDPESTPRTAAALRILIAHAHQLPNHLLPSLPDDRKLLARAARDIPRVLDIQHKHPLPDDHAFTMRPGFRNFDPIRSDQHLADDHGVPVHAPHFRVPLIKGRRRILLPLYQRQGSEGFFIARPISRVWLALSAILRRLNTDRIAPLLPGVRKHNAFAATLTVDRRIARFVAIDIFHLLGYRLMHRDTRSIVVSRRMHDLTAPAAPRLSNTSESPQHETSNPSMKTPAE